VVRVSPSKQYVVNLGEKMSNSEEYDKYTKSAAFAQKLQTSPKTSKFADHLSSNSPSFIKNMADTFTSTVLSPILEDMRKPERTIEEELNS
jgi:hypothetical protein